MFFSSPYCRHCQRQQPNRFIAYLFVGTIATLISYGIFLAAYTIGAQYLVAVAAGYVLSAVFHFTANRSLTFAANGPVQSQLPKYAVVSALNCLVAVIGSAFFVEVLRFDPRVAAVLVIFITIFLGYYLSKSWVFKS